jgi:glycosyltransferase 2 family protein
MVTLKWGWVLAGVGLASMDWFGGGVRLWILVRHVDPTAPLKGSILAGGMNTWASYLTPSQTGGGPMMIYALQRYGTPIPEATIASLMSFVATVVFFAIAGPLTILLGAGRSLEQHGVLGQSLTLLDVFRVSLATFVGIGVVMLLLFIFPGRAARLARSAVARLESRSPRLAGKLANLPAGIERARECLVAFFKGKGWLALFAGVVTSGLAFANKLLAGYVVLRMLGIQEHFIDVLLLQTLITFLLYFSPTPGGAGLAEILSVAVMSIYVAQDLTPSYILLWRMLLAYLTLGFGSFVFYGWLRSAERGVEAPEPVASG